MWSFVAWVCYVNLLVLVDHVSCVVSIIFLMVNGTPQKQCHNYIRQTL